MYGFTYVNVFFPPMILMLTFAYSYHISDNEDVHIPTTAFNKSRKCFFVLWSSLKSAFMHTGGCILVSNTRCCLHNTSSRPTAGRPLHSYRVGSTWCVWTRPSDRWPSSQKLDKNRCHSARQRQALCVHYSLLWLRCLCFHVTMVVIWDVAVPFWSELMREFEMLGGM